MPELLALLQEGAMPGDFSCKLILTHPGCIQPLALHFRSVHWHRDGCRTAIELNKMTFKLIKKLSLALMFFAVTNGSVAGSLSDARNAYSTRSIKAVKAPQAYSTLTAPKGVREVTYQSGKLQLKAWITTSNKGKNLYPP
jgi:hypothetical protein